MKKKFYLTTAITYTSSAPHIGNVYEAILSDSIVRYKRKMGFDCFFMTGTDEHGQKIENKAIKAGISPQAHVDMISDTIKEVYKMVDISYDKFIRTTDDYHMVEVQEAFKKLYDNGDIYKGFYEGWYCVDCESYYTEKDLVEGHCPDCGAKVDKAKEEAYFMKLAKYQDRLIEHIKTNPDFIQPESRKNEMLNNFLKETLPDLCVSRTSYKWGIPVSFDTKHVIYVWLDALMNYITGIGYHCNKKSDAMFNKYWPADVHVIGKDILRFHTIYWPIMLMALDVELPHQIFGHPWILVGTDKMSKSKGNVVYTEDLVKTFGVDKVRYYVLHEIPFAQDGSITYELVAERTNSDLANTFGNLVNRSLAMVNKYFNGKVSMRTDYLPFDKELKIAAINAKNQFMASMDQFKVSDAIEAVNRLVRRANKYVDETEPWVLAKSDDKKDCLENVLYNLLEVVRFASVMYECIMPKTANAVYDMLKTNTNSYESLADFGTVKTYEIGVIEVLFSRIDLKDIIDDKKVDLKQESEKVAESELISIDDFSKIELVVGKIVSAQKHPKADKLLVFQVDIKSEVRQIVSGIAKYYDPDTLIGRKVVVLKNLKPINLRGYESKGMLLCAENSDMTELELINIDGLNPGDVIK